MKAELVETGVLVIGGGAAAVRAALSAGESGADVVILSSGHAGASGSSFVNINGGWGMQALVGDERTEDNLERFFIDIADAGLGMADEKLVRILVEESGEAFEELVKYGMRFRKDEAGNYLREKGCFSHEKRAFISFSRQNIRDTFATMLHASGASVIEGTALRLMVYEGKCYGCLALNKAGDPVLIKSRATVLATGGGAGLFRDNIVSDGLYGEGYALAREAGAELVNMEFIQFMLGWRENGKIGFIYLDELEKERAFIGVEDEDVLEEIFPCPEEKIDAVRKRLSHYPFSCRDLSCLIDREIAVRRGIKNVRRPEAEVFHLAHAFNGGVRIDEHGESTLSGLFAAGEVAGGMHGADRIGGAMITATQVFGKRAGRSAGKRAVNKGEEALPDLKTPLYKTSSFEHEITMKIADLLSKHVGIVRREEGLRLCLDELNSMDCESFSRASLRITAAKMICRAAFKRRESRGSHFREDFPETDDKYAKPFILRKNG